MAWTTLEVTLSEELKSRLEAAAQQQGSERSAWCSSLLLIIQKQLSKSKGWSTRCPPCKSEPEHVQASDPSTACQNSIWEGQLLLARLPCGGCSLMTVHPALSPRAPLPKWPRRPRCQPLQLAGAETSGQSVQACSAKLRCTYADPPAAESTEAHWLQTASQACTAAAK